MSANVFDKIGASAPVNKQAAMSASRGFEYQSPARAKHASTICSDTPLECAAVPPGTMDMTGHKTGRLTVIGYRGSSKQVGAQWVVRCACGSYSVRSGRAIRRGSAIDQCIECEHVTTLRKRAYFITHGRYPE